MMDYKTIKRTAKERGVPVGDLCVLARQNDPFYCGSPGEVKAARWFAEVWQRYGYTTGVHLRRVHYRLVSGPPGSILKTDGTPYENTDNCWTWLCNAGKYARYLGLVSVEAFIDQRNPKPIVNASWSNYRSQPHYELESNGWAGFHLPRLPQAPSLPAALPDLPEFTVGGYQNQQAYHIEVWCEKTTMNDVLVPLCAKYRANFVTGAGEMSITSAWDAMKRIDAASRPARILYISDFDPAGYGMPKSVARKIEYFARQPGVYVDVRLQPIVLTPDQVAEYNLPRAPIKESELRKDGWEVVHGTGAVELDALEALHPGELREIVEAAILQYYDPYLYHETEQAEARLADDLAWERDRILEQYLPMLDDLARDYRAIRGDFEQTSGRLNELIQSTFQPEFDRYSERLARISEAVTSIRDETAEELKTVDLDLDADYPLPGPVLPDETDGTLYDSSRDYFEQLSAYKAHVNGGNDDR